MSESVKKILAEAAGRKPKREQNQRSAYKTAIRERMSQVGIEISAAYFTVAREGQINNIKRHHDWDFLIKSVHWLFDNWHHVTKTGLFKSAAQPTFGALVSQSTLEHFYTHIRDGTSLAEMEHTGYSGPTPVSEAPAAEVDTEQQAAKFAELDRLRAERRKQLAGTH